MESISVRELAKLGEDALILDVREDYEYVDVRVPWATHIPLGDLVERVAEVPDDRTVYVMCHAGGRSARAAEYLVREGREAVNIDGGISEWEANDLPTQRGK